MSSGIPLVPSQDAPGPGVRRPSTCRDRGMPPVCLNGLWMTLILRQRERNADSHGPVVLGRWLEKDPYVLSTEASVFVGIFSVSRRSRRRMRNRGCGGRRLCHVLSVTLVESKPRSVGNARHEGREMCQFCVLLCPPVPRRSSPTRWTHACVEGLFTGPWIKKQSPSRSQGKLCAWPQHTGSAAMPCKCLHL